MVERDREQAWTNCLEKLGLDPLTFASQSKYDPWRRTYVLNRRLYKISLKPRDSVPVQRAQDLGAEFEILRRCQGIRGIPVPVSYDSTDEFEALVVEQLAGEPLADTQVGPIALLTIMRQLAIIIFKVCRRGISHNDIRAQNVLLAADGAVSLIDFDQATRTSLVAALARSFTGLCVGGGAVWASFWTIPKMYLRKRLPRPVAALLRRVLGRGRSRAQTKLPALGASASRTSKQLFKAWEVAQASDASAPGATLAYYSLEMEGYHFPGERPWMDRWDVLKRVADYRGKRILELGCNMALLSSFLLKEMGAAEAMAVDVDEAILLAAEHLSQAFGVRPRLVQQDLDDPAPWEERLAAFEPDIVFALNVLNWVADKKRLMAFLGRFEEVIFEGHERVAVEAKRFEDVGFPSIEFVGVSERGRGILRCRKRASD